jgi:type IV pilus assembly protein PilA
MKKFLRPAFTLVEIMIVVVIIGILAAIALPAFQQARNTSQTNSIMENLRVIVSAAQQYLIATGSASQVDVNTLVSNQYLGTAPTPVAGESYTALPAIKAEDISVSITATIGGTQTTITYNF